MVRRRRMTRILPRTDKPSTDPDHDDELDGLLVEVLDPTCASEEEEEELDLTSLRRKLAESVGAPVSVCAKIFLHGGDYLFERTSPDHPLIIGRHESSDLVIPENSVSRRHAELTYNDDAWFLRDLDSRSGTKVNDETATGTVRLREGDRVQFGNAVLDVSFSMPSDSDADNQPASLLDGKQAIERKGKSSVRIAGPGDTPVLMDDVPNRGSGASTPSVNVTGSSRSSSSADRAALSRSPKSGRAEAKKRQMVVQDRREIEKIKTFGIVGGVLILAFVVYGILSGIKWSDEPTSPPAVKNQADRKRSTEKETAKAPDTKESTSTEPGEKTPPANTTVPTPEGTQPVRQEQGTPATAPVVVDAKPELPVAPVMDRLPDAPEPLLAERSPFEPRWFAGPGPGVAVTEKGETLKGAFLIEGDTIHADVAGTQTKSKLVEMKELVWEGARDFKEADALLRGGDYAAAAERYAETLRGIEAALLDAGKDPAQYPGRWYVEGRRNECMLKASHLGYCQAVFDHSEWATAEQLNAAGASFVRVATKCGTPKGLREKFDALLKAGRILLSAVDQDRWSDLNQQCRKPAP